jgi:hypothetical protein
MPLYKFFLNNLLNVLVQIANKIGLQKKVYFDQLLFKTEVFPSARQNVATAVGNWFQGVCVWMNVHFAMMEGRNVASGGGGEKLSLRFRYERVTTLFSSFSL